MIIVLAYFIRKTPFSVKTTSALLHQIEVSVEEASISLGVPPFATFLKVVVPSMGRGLISQMKKVRRSPFLLIKITRNAQCLSA